MKDSHRTYFQKKGDKNNNDHFYDRKPVINPFMLWQEPQIENIKIIFNNNHNNMSEKHSIIHA